MTFAVARRARDDLVAIGDAGLCDAWGMPSTSLLSAITGGLDPQRATHAVGMPATPVSMV